VIVRSVAKYAVARLTPGLINFLALALFTRLLTERQYGVYALVVAGTTLAYAVTLQWLSLAVLRFSAVATSPRPVFLSTVRRTFLPFAILGAAGLILVARVSGWEVGWEILCIGGGLLVVHAWYDLNLMLVTADREPGAYGTLAGIRAVVGVAIGAGLAAAGGGEVAVLIGVTTGTAMAGAWAWWRRWRGSLGVSGDPALRAELVHYGLPLAGSYLLDYVVSSSDRLLLGAMLSAAVAGLYAPAYDLCQQALWATMIVVNLAAYPLAVRAVDEGDPAQRERQLRTHAALLLAVALPSAVGLAVLAPSVATLLGSRFSPAAGELIPILAPAILVGGLKSYYSDLSFQLARATKYQLATVAVGALANLGLNLWWIPVAGIRGAAYATLVAYVATLIVSWWLSRRVLPLPIPYGPVAFIALATLGMSGALWLVRDGRGLTVLAGQIGLGMVVYLGLLMLLVRGRLSRLLAT